MNLKLSISLIMIQDVYVLQLRICKVLDGFSVHGIGSASIPVRSRSGK